MESRPPPEPVGAARVPVAAETVSHVTDLAVGVAVTEHAEHELGARRD